VCGPPQYSELRINLSQAFNGIGAVAAPVLGSYVFFVFDEDAALRNVQWVYLSIACLAFCLGLIFYFSDIPEITDADMELQTAETPVAPFREQYRLFHAAFAQYCYTGAQVAIASCVTHASDSCTSSVDWNHSFFINYVIATRADTDSALGAKFLAGAQAAFAVGRFGGLALMRFVKPRLVLGVFLAMCIVFTAPAITQRGNVGIAMVYGTFFFESVCFPTIMALGMRGLGRHTKRGSGFIVAGVFGGACVPPLMGAVADRHGNAVSMVVPLCFFIMAWTYALAVNFSPRYRDVVDEFALPSVSLLPRDRVDAGTTGPRDVGDATEELEKYQDLAQRKSPLQ